MRTFHLKRSQLRCKERDSKRGAHIQTTVMVTHDANAAAMADRVLFLADGQIVRDQGRSEPAAVLAAMSEVSAL